MSIFWGRWSRENKSNMHIKYRRLILAWNRNASTSVVFFSIHVCSYGAMEWGKRKHYQLNWMKKGKKREQFIKTCKTSRAIELWMVLISIKSEFYRQKPGWDGLKNGLKKKNTRHKKTTSLIEWSNNYQEKWKISLEIYYGVSASLTPSKRNSVWNQRIFRDSFSNKSTQSVRKLIEFGWLPDKCCKLLFGSRLV